MEPRRPSVDHDRLTGVLVLCVVLRSLTRLPLLLPVYLPRSDSRAVRYPGRCAHRFRRCFLLSVLCTRAGREGVAGAQDWHRSQDEYSICAGGTGHAISNCRPDIQLLRGWRRLKPRTGFDVQLIDVSLLERSIRFILCQSWYQTGNFVIDVVLIVRDLTIRVCESSLPSSCHDISCDSHDIRRNHFSLLLSVADTEPLLHLCHQINHSSWQT